MKYESRKTIENLFNAQGKKRWVLAKTTAHERAAKLKKLRKAIIEHKQELYDAIWADFHKPKFEAWECEIFPAIEEIDEAINHLDEWMEEKKGKWVFFLPTTQSYLKYEPKGRTLIFAPWNYPFLLMVSPIVSAIAAGNTVIAKPSHKTPHVSSFIASLFEQTFESDEIAIIEGEGAAIGDDLLQFPFDHVFFTGSPKVGAHVAELAAKQHASCTLELGGKSPTVILPNASIKDAAKKIAWGKMLNAGQTCIAPDYVLCPEEMAQEFAEAVATEIKKMYGDTEEDRFNSEDIVHIVDAKAIKHHRALIEDALSNGATQILGGKCDVQSRYTPPTILTGVTAKMDIMQAEIFGPILPIVAYKDIGEAINFIQNRPKPLALYIFGKQSDIMDRILNETTSGSVCINNTIIQIENLSMPFGGVGMSGTGNYHGFYGFRAFSHERNVMEQKKFDIVSLFHAPYGVRNSKQRKKLQGFIEKALGFLKEF